MICVNIELLLCTLSTFYVTYVTCRAVDSPENSLGGLGLLVDLGLSYNASHFVKSNQSLLHAGLTDDTVGSNNLNLNDPEISEISALFAKRSDLSILSSTLNSSTTSKTFVDDLGPLLSHIGLQSPLHDGFSNNANKTLIVPSEGGLMQDSSMVMSAQTTNRTMKGSNAAGSTPEEIHMTEGEPQSSRPTEDMRHEDVPGAKKQLTPQESHISARKGATLLEKSELNSSTTNVTMEQFTFPITESTFTQEVRQQKIAPRKGAEMPKIFPRKGVEDKIDDMKSTDPVFSEKNNGTISTSIVTNSTLAGEVQMSRTTPTSPLASKPTINLLNDVKDSRPTTDSAKIFQTTTNSQKISTPYTDSSSSVISPTLKPFHPELKPGKPTGIDVVNNIDSNLSVPSSGLNNSTEDKSGIIASFPPLRKRLKPLKTTDTNIINSSPSPPEHISSDHDYIVPIVVTILTIPMLVVLVLFLYKKGSEFWERRHYRRMDFLIDGMYND